MKLLNVLDTQVELLKIKQEINSKVKNEIDQQQREYYLNNQLRTIQEELGMDDDEEIENCVPKHRRKTGLIPQRRFSRRKLPNLRNTIPHLRNTATI